MDPKLWIAGLASAFMLKLASSIDDVVWLAPFLTRNVSSMMQFSHAAIYLSVCMTQTLVAMLIAYSGDKTVDFLLRNAKDAWSSERILTVAAGGMMFLYAIKLTYDYFMEEDEGEEDAAAGAAASPAEGSPTAQYDQVPQTDPEAGTGSKVSPTDENSTSPTRQLSPVPKVGQVTEANLALNRETSPSAPLRQTSNLSRTSRTGSKVSSRVERRKSIMERLGTQQALDAAAAMTAKEREQQQNLVCIAFIGSIDDLTVFVPMLVGKGFDLAQLMVGSFSAGLTIVILCVFLGMCKPVADCLSAVPLAVIVGVFSCVLLVKGIFFLE